MPNKERVTKALECCASKPRPKCKECPMGEKRGCAVELYSLALSVIKECKCKQETKVQGGM